LALTAALLCACSSTAHGFQLRCQSGPTRKRSVVVTVRSHCMCAGEQVRALTRAHTTGRQQGPRVCPVRAHPGRARRHACVPVLPKPPARSGGRQTPHHALLPRPRGCGPARRHEPGECARRVLPSAGATCQQPAPAVRRGTRVCVCVRARPQPAYVCHGVLVLVCVCGECLCASLLSVCLSVCLSLSLSLCVYVCFTYA